LRIQRLSLIRGKGISSTNPTRSIIYTIKRFIKRGVESKRGSLNSISKSWQTLSKSTWSVNTCLISQPPSKIYSKFGSNTRFYWIVWKNMRLFSSKTAFSGKTKCATYLASLEIWGRELDRYLKPHPIFKAWLVKDLYLKFQLMHHLRNNKIKKRSQLIKV
jgi:hypothetical protein